LSDIGRRLRPVFARYPRIKAVYLFGSAASGRARADSDLDLAVVPERPLGSDKLALLTDLAAEGLERVDLVSLEGDDVVLRFEALRPNRLLYAAADFDHGEYYSRVIREYFDFEPYLLRQREALRRRLHGTAP
jgi:predicted nucleotidyltransferase